MSNTNISQRFTQWLRDAREVQGLAVEIAKTRGRAANREEASFCASLSVDNTSVTVRTGSNSSLEVLFQLCSGGLSVVCPQEIFTLIDQMQATTGPERWIKEIAAGVWLWANEINSSGFLESEPLVSSSDMHPKAALIGKAIFGSIPTQEQSGEVFEQAVVSWSASVSIETSHLKGRSVKATWSYWKVGKPAVFCYAAHRGLISEKQSLSWPADWFVKANGWLEQSEIGRPLSWHLSARGPIKAPSAKVLDSAETLVCTSIIDNYYESDAAVGIKGEWNLVYQGNTLEFFRKAWSPAWGKFFWKWLERTICNRPIRRRFF